MGKDGEVVVTGHAIVPAGTLAFADGVLRVRLEEVSRADAPATVVAEASASGVTHPGTAGAETQVPFHLSVQRCDVPIDPRRDYAVRATLDIGGGRRLSTTDRHPVLTRGFGHYAALRLHPDT
jgi:putative lipoprotein